MICCVSIPAVSMKKFLGLRTTIILRLATSSRIKEDTVYFPVIYELLRETRTSERIRQRFAKVSNIASWPLVVHGSCERKKVFDFGV